MSSQAHGSFQLQSWHAAMRALTMAVESPRVLQLEGGKCEPGTLDRCGRHRLLADLSPKMGDSSSQLQQINHFASLWQFFFFAACRSDHTAEICGFPHLLSGHIVTRLFPPPTYTDDILEFVFYPLKTQWKGQKLSKKLALHQVDSNNVLVTVSEASLDEHYCLGQGDPTVYCLGFAIFMMATYSIHQCFPLNHIVTTNM